MKKILVFNDYYFPASDVGGPVTSIYNAVSALSDSFDFYIEAYNHNYSDKTPFLGIETNKWYDRDNAHVIYHSSKEIDFKRKRIKELIEQVNPDLIWFSGLLRPHKLHSSIRIAEKLGIPVLISPRGEASPDRMRLKGYKKFPYAFIVSLSGLYKKKNVFFHATSSDEIIGLKKYWHIHDEKIFTVRNIGVQSSEVEKKEKAINSINIIFMSRIHAVKQLDYAIDVISKMKTNVAFDIWGPIESKSYWEKCKKMIANAPSNINITYKGVLNPANARDCFRRYHCMIFPTINENYGHVIAESLANNCPVVLSLGTTPWDDLNNKAGFAIPLDDKEKFVEKLEFISKMDTSEYSRFMETTHRYYKSKTALDNTVIGHREMFLKVIGYGDK